jgi:arabinoxylan arabinofuranohydrolase
MVDLRCKALLPITESLIIDLHYSEYHITKKNQETNVRKLYFLSFLLGLLLIVGFCAEANASNPVISTAYSADPSAHVFKGRMYIYASHDRNDAREFDVVDYHVYSSDDLQNWKDHGIAFRLSDTSWARSHLWAPDCAFWKGRYYLFFPAQDAAGKFHIGVAVSDSPAGPFIDKGSPIAGPEGIDPSIFIDGDNAYLIWAQNGAMIARMTPDMSALAETPKKLDGLDNLFEGPWIFKRNDSYYLTYPAFRPGGVGRGGHGQNYDYAVAKDPMGPYVYKGAFTQSGPGGDNIHGSQVEWNGKWYCFYHDFSTSVGRPSHGYKRAVKMDEMHFGPDGSILPLQWTKEGPPQLHPLNAFSQLEAATLNSTDIPEGEHAVAVDQSKSGIVYLGPVMHGAWVKYAGVDFGKGANRFEVNAASATGGGNIDIHIDAMSGPLLAICTVRYTGGWQRWSKQSCVMKDISGIHDLYLVFSGAGNSGLFNFDSFRFSKSEETQ